MDGRGRDKDNIRDEDWDGHERRNIQYAYEIPPTVPAADQATISIKLAASMFAAVAVAAWTVFLAYNSSHTEAIETKIKLTTTSEQIAKDLGDIKKDIEKIRDDIDKNKLTHEHDISSINQKINELDQTVTQLYQKVSRSR